MIVTNRNEATNSAMSFTKFVSTKWTSRLVGSNACLECGEYIFKTLNSFCDSTQKETFYLHPGAFLGYFRIIVVLFFVSLIALFFKAFYIAVIPITLSVLILIFQFFFYKELLDPFYAKKEGLNVFGSIEPENEVKQQIIFSAHHDSAHIFNHYENSPEKYGIKILAGSFAILIMFVSSWLLFTLNIFNALSTPIVYTILFILAISSLSLYFFWTFYAKNNGTPGAGDNIASLAVAIEIGKYFSKLKQLGKGLKHTRIVVASWDGEEAGLRGARAFVKAHKHDLNKTKTYNFNLECMYDEENLHFLTSDLNGFVPLSKKMVNQCISVSEKLNYSTASIAFPLLAGGTDAAEFAKIGIEATTLVAMKWENKDTKSMNYHTTRDTIEAVDKLAVYKSIDIGINYAIEKDENITLTNKPKL